MDIKPEAMPVRAPKRLAGKVAFITGGGAGIGQAASLLFASEGCAVVIADISGEGGRETAGRILETGGEAFCLQVDVTSQAGVAHAMREAVARYGGLNVIYNNAGGSLQGEGGIVDVAEAVFWATLRLNLFGTWLTCQAGIPILAASGGGSIINSASYTALIGVKSKAAYATTKGAVISLTRSIAADYASQGVRANAIAPGATLTARVRRLLEEVPEVRERSKRHLLGLAEPMDVARTALYLASDDSRMMTGQVISVDGGAATCTV